MSSIVIDSTTRLTVDLFTFLCKKIDSNIKLLQNNFCWYSLLDEPTLMKMKQDLIFSKKNRVVIPVLESVHNDVLICISDKLILVFDISDEITLLNSFSTPEQVWQELIKPDIEEYYGIKIEE